MIGIGPLLPAGAKMSQREYDEWREEHLWRPSSIAGLKVPPGTSAADWIAGHLHPGTFEVRMTVPDCFAAYARIFYAYCQNEHSLTTWTEVARRNGRVAHALMEQETISADAENRSDRWFPGHRLAGQQYEALAPILARHTSSEIAWFLLWDGFGNVDPQPFTAQPEVEHEWRSYHLLCGPLDAFGEFENPPSYCWPDDRAWCLCTDIDFAWAYLAGTTACIDEAIATSVIDAYRTDPTHPARSGMDTINDPDGSAPRSH